jgi:hypothetical protein
MTFFSVVPAQAGIQVLRSYLAARYDLKTEFPLEFIERQE